jgi:excisionase family DNA binding protein
MIASDALTIKEAAGILGVSIHTMYARNARGDGPAYTRGGFPRRCWYDPNDVARHLAEQTILSALRADYLTAEQAAERRCVHVRTVKRWMARGDITVYDFGHPGAIARLRKSDVDAYDVPKNAHPRNTTERNRP